MNKRVKWNENGVEGMGWDPAAAKDETQGPG